MGDTEFVGVLSLLCWPVHQRFFFFSPNAFKQLIYPNRDGFFKITKLSSLDRKV